MLELQVAKQDLNQCRVVENQQSADSVSLQSGEVLLKVERFAFTANNMTYGVMGDQLGYWQFFPVMTDGMVAGENTPAATDGWGTLPVWGFAAVVASESADIPVGERLFGYFPPAEQVVMLVTHATPGTFIDGSAHRAKLPPGYNIYRRVNAEPGYNPQYDDLRSLLWPLYMTSFCLWDAAKEQNWYGAEQIIVGSASSKTSLGLGYALNADPECPTVIALTSKRNAEFVQGVGYYDQTLTYDDIANIDASKPTLIIDMSGSGPILSELAAHLGDNLKYCVNVGITHWDDSRKADALQGRSEMFFAPGHIQKRMAEWGAQKFGETTNGFVMKATMAAQNWLEIKHIDSIAALAQHYEAVCTGQFPANQGLIVEL